MAGELQALQAAVQSLADAASGLSTVLTQPAPVVVQPAPDTIPVADLVPIISSVQAVATMIQNAVTNAPAGSVAKMAQDAAQATSVQATPVVATSA